MSSAIEYLTEEVNKSDTPAMGTPRALVKGPVSKCFCSKSLEYVPPQGEQAKGKRKWGVIPGGCLLTNYTAAVLSASSEQMLNYYSRAFEDYHLSFFILSPSLKINTLYLTLVFFPGTLRIKQSDLSPDLRIWRKIQLALLESSVIDAVNTIALTFFCNCLKFV